MMCCTITVIFAALFAVGETVCSTCSGSEYEARPCRGTENRQCMHVAHPLLMSGTNFSTAFMSGLKVVTSENVFLENLHATRNLETTYYVTDGSQATDFFWVRESGLQVHIGIHDIKLIAEYEDVTHDSDNKYMFSNPNTNEDKTKFRDMVRNKCRHPIPDYYSITLERARDRITTAQEILCDSSDSTKPPCPHNYRDGDKYLFRSLNEPCQKMAKGTFPEPMLPAANSIVCTKNTPLLREIFNQSFASERPIQLPIRHCRQARSRCDQCLNQPRCQMSDIFDQKCCQTDCYTLRDCKEATSDRCAQVPVECAMGDAFRYTIQPVFQHLKSDFSCHVRHKKPKILYHMFFHVKVPGPYGPKSEFNTPRLYKTAYGTDSGFQAHGSFQADYLSVEHSAGLHLNEEFMLKGHEDASRWNYSLFDLKAPDDFVNKKIIVHEISQNIYVASTQFLNPFSYSTSSWVRNNECDKDINKFKFVQKHYRETSAQPVNVMIQAVEDPYRYFLKSTDNPPFIRFMVPGNTSVLPYYFGENGPQLYTNGSLSVELETKGHLWEIHLTGLMSDCPGYVSISIVDLLEDDELFRYDLLLFCPNAFNATFKVPNRHRKPERAFEVRLEDSRKSYHVFLTHMLFDAPFLTLHSLTHSQSAEVEPQEVRSTVPVVGFMVSTTAIILVVLTFCYAYHSCTAKSEMYSTKCVSYRRGSDSFIPEEGKRSPVFCPQTRLSQKQYMIIVTYVIIRVIYSLVFTFTMFRAILSVAVEDDAFQLSGLTEFQKRKYKGSKALSHEVEEFGRQELLRQAELVTSMQGACTHYIDDIFHGLTHQMDNITHNFQRQQMYGTNTSMSALMQEWYNHKSSIYQQHITRYTDKLRANFSLQMGKSLQSFRRFLSSVYKSEWLAFPMLLYNKTLYNQHHVGFQPRAEFFNGSEGRFASFLPIAEVEEAVYLNIQLWERFKIILPPLPFLPLPLVMDGHAHCDGAQAFLPNMTSLMTSPSQHHSSRFITSHSSETITLGPSLVIGDEVREFKFLTESDSDSNKDDFLRVTTLLDTVSIGIVQTIFVILDVCLLIYRISRIALLALNMCNGLDVTNVIEVEQEKKKRVKFKLPEEGDFYVDKQIESHGVLSDKYDISEKYISSCDSQKSMLAAELVQQSCKQNGGSVPYIEKAVQKKFIPKPPKWKRMSVFDKFVAMVGDPLVSTIVVGAAVVLFLFVVMETVCVLFSVGFITDMDDLHLFTSGLEVQVNRTNWYLAEQAEYFNNITIDIYKSQMQSELLNYQGIMEFFNSEQKRMTKNFVKEACATYWDAFSNYSCDIAQTPARLHLLTVPCNFIPIQPQFYTELALRSVAEDFGPDLEQYLSSGRSLVVMVGYTLIFSICAILSIHIMGIVCLHYISSRQIFPINLTVLTPMAGLSTLVATGEAEEAESEEADSEEEEGGKKEYSPIHSERKRCPPPPPRVKQYKLNGILSSLRYSETKV